MISSDAINLNSKSSVKSLIVKFFEILTLSIFVSILMHNTLTKYSSLCHSVLELICVAIAFSIFISVWYLDNRNSVSRSILGFGFLSIAIFDLLHTIWYLQLSVAGHEYFDLSVKFWIMGRVIEAVVLLLSIQLPQRKLKKWTSLFITLIVSLGTFCFIVVYNEYLPILLTNQGVTYIKIMLEYGVMFIYGITLYKIKHKVDCDAVITYKYIFMALLISISSEFCFTLYESVNSISFAIGHLLKVISYYFLFRGIFISTILYPYKELEIEHKNLEKTTEELRYTSETLKDLMKVVGTDITEFKKDEKKLIQQEKLALLGQMGAEIVHETRNFLTTIKGRSQLISNVTENQDVKKHALKVNEEVDEVNRIISEFLFLSKPRESELIEVSMVDIFKSIESMVKSSSLMKGISIDFQLSKEERYVRCDEAELKQVILNICKNAVDAMIDKSNAKLKVETGLNELDNEMFIKVTDNGIGISEENLKKIGTPFFTTKKTGTGLGLNVCHKIMKEHKGKIEVESTLGKGTTFSIILPCIDDEGDEAAM